MPPFLLKGFTLRPTCMFRQLGSKNSIIPLPSITNNLIDQGLMEKKPRSWTLIFDHVTWISIRIIYFPGADFVSSLAAIRQKGHRIQSGQQQFDNDLYSCDLYDNYCTKFGTSKQKGYKILWGQQMFDIDFWPEILYLRITLRQATENCMSLQRWSILAL